MAYVVEVRQGAGLLRNKLPEVGEPSAAPPQLRVY